jgi:hypothetical protein
MVSSRAPEELGDAAGRLLDESLLDSVVLGHLGLQIFLTLENSADVALQFDNFAGDGQGGPGSHQAASQGAGKHGARKDKNVTRTHDESSTENAKNENSGANLPIYWEMSGGASGCMGMFAESVQWR